MLSAGRILNIPPGTSPRGGGKPNLGILLLAPWSAPRQSLSTLQGRQEIGSKAGGKSNVCPVPGDASQDYGLQPNSLGLALGLAGKHAVGLEDACEADIGSDPRQAQVIFWAGKTSIDY